MAATVTETKKDAQTLPLDPESLSTMPEPGWHRKIWFHYFTAYRILIALILLSNALVLGLLFGLHNNTGGALLSTAVNLLVAVIIRQEDLVNVYITQVARIPSSLPLGLRKVIADAHHHGGVHIGCAISSLAWYSVFVFDDTKDFIRVIRTKSGEDLACHYADVITCYAFLTCILIICGTSHPLLRAKFHNTFERTHRFFGWLSLAVLWTHTGLHPQTDPSAPPVYAAPGTWLLAATTFLVILPWLRIRRVPITASPVSKREVKITFPYANMPYRSTCRFSTARLLEWHAFATIPCVEAPDTQACIIVSATGDWTKALMANPPSHLWIRHPPAADFLHFTPLFNSILLVATGAGVGPMVSLLHSLARQPTPGQRIRVMWSVYDASEPHWVFVVDSIRAVDPEARLVSSRDGRADVVFESTHMMQYEDIEACMVVSNKGLTDKLVRAVRSSGRGAYGAVFDS